MIDKTKIVESVIERLKGLPMGNYLDLRTYKRNRSVIIVKKSEDEFLVIEDGFDKERFHVKSEKLKKLLTVLLKKEFPRSHKIRLYSMGVFIEDRSEKIKRKIL
jgi:hypothetical protein